VGLKTVQKWMGHARIETTLRYAHLAPDAFDEAVAALDGWAEKQGKEAA
jgi:site-specific recombinase XerD